MRLAYFDCFSGVTGAMALGSLVHAGADLDHIAERLERLPTIGFVLERETVDAGGISATRVHVKVLPQDIIRTYEAGFDAHLLKPVGSMELESGLGPLRCVSPESRWGAKSRCAAIYR